MEITETIRFGIQIPRDQFNSIEEILRVSALIEKNGFESVWLEDHIIEAPIPKWLECFTCLTAVSMKSQRLCVGSLVTDHLRRHPVTLAQTASTMNDLTQGKMILGIGAGEAYQLLPIDLPTDHRFQRFLEALEIIRLIWASDNPDASVTYLGKYFKLKNFPNKPIKPTQIPPIYIAAFGTKMLELTGRLGDGWIPFSNTAESYKDSLQLILSNGKERKEKFTPSSVLFSSLADNRYDAYKQISKLAKHHAIWVNSIRQKTGIILPKELSLAGLPSLEHDGVRLDEVAKRIPDKLAIETVIAGNTQDWIEQIDKFIRAGMRHIVFRIEYPLSANIDKTLHTVGSKVLPYFLENTISETR